MSALVVVDLQEDFLPANGALAVTGGRDIVGPIVEVLDRPWDVVVATQDWHPANHCSFALTHGVAPYTELDFDHPLGKRDKEGKLLTQTQTVWPNHCVQRTHGAAIEPAFLAAFNNLKVPKTIVQKGYLQDREYYSCFKDTWKLHKTEIEDFLRSHGVERVYFVGLAYDFCVLNSAVDAAASGFTSYVVQDLSRSVFPDNQSKTDEAYTAGGVSIVTSNNL